VVRLPSAIVSSYTLISTGELKLFVFLGLIIMMVLVTAAWCDAGGQRKIPVQYAKRVVDVGCTAASPPTSRCGSTPRVSSRSSLPPR